VPRVKRALSSFLLLFLIAAPAARADGFREAEVRKALSAAGLGSVADTVAEASRPALTVKLRRLAQEPAALGTTRFGGRPDLPAGTAWPRCKGRHQTFLAQVRVRDLPAAARELRRVGGTLLFFTDVQFEPGVREYGLWGGDCTKVVHARASTGLTRTPFPGDVLELKPSTPRFSARPDLPGLALDADMLMAPLREVVIPDWEAWYEIRHALNGKPRLGHRLLGYGDALNGGDECSARLERAQGAWRHLFTLGYDERLGWEVADGGVIQILISPADLRAGRFDRVCGTFDSA
jgi:hypothetical protein